MLLVSSMEVFMKKLVSLKLLIVMTINIISGVVYCMRTSGRPKQQKSQSIDIELIRNELNQYSKEIIRSLQKTLTLLPDLQKMHILLQKKMPKNIRAFERTIVKQIKTIDTFELLLKNTKEVLSKKLGLKKIPTSYNTLINNTKYDQARYIIISIIELLPNLITYIINETEKRDRIILAKKKELGNKKQEIDNIRNSWQLFTSFRKELLKKTEQEAEKIKNEIEQFSNAKESQKIEDEITKLLDEKIKQQIEILNKQLTEESKMRYELKAQINFYQELERSELKKIKKMPRLFQKQPKTETKRIIKKQTRMAISPIKERLTIAREIIKKIKNKITWLTNQKERMLNTLRNQGKKALIDREIKKLLDIIIRPKKREWGNKIKEIEHIKKTWFLSSKEKILEKVNNEAEKIEATLEKLIVEKKEFEEQAQVHNLAQNLKNLMTIIDTYLQAVDREAAAVYAIICTIVKAIEQAEHLNNYPKKAKSKRVQEVSKCKQVI